MVEIVDGLLIKDELTKNAMGGTELMAHRLLDNVNKELLKNVQIIFSRPNNLIAGKKKILYLHDLPEDPSISNLSDLKYQEQFDLFVFVSSYQRGIFNRRLGIPYERSIVINNAIEPFPLVKKPDDKLRFIYHTTPHRGLRPLYYIFDLLSRDFSNIELNVFSSFEIYGWKNRDEPFKRLFDMIDKHPNMNYHKNVSNEKIREELLKTDIFLYPSIWEETSCLALIEAMSANCLCIHSDYGALRETGMGLTSTYDFLGDNYNSIRLGYKIAYSFTKNIIDNGCTNNARPTKIMADLAYNIDKFVESWNIALRRVKM